MGILLPAALGLLALAIPIIIFYMLRQRRHDWIVSSSLLWRRAVLDRTVNAPWRKPLRSMLLLVQLLLLALLVFSFARPFIFTNAVATGNIVAILDASASMQATDEEGGITRFERARREVDALIGGLQPSQRMSIIWAGPTAQMVVAASGSPTALRDALGALAPSNGKADMPAAVTLSAAAARQLGDATVVLISDGSLAGVSDLPQVPARATYVNVGTSSRNVGITSLSLRDAQGGPQLFASVYNSGSQPASALLTIKVDGELRDSRRIALAPGQEQPINLQGLPLDTRLVEAALVVDDRSADVLAADNAAWALRPARDASNVLLVTEGNGFLEKALNLLPNVRLFKATPAAYVPSDGFGLTVLDGYIPAQLPAGNLLLFAPPNSPLVPVSGTLAYPAIGPVTVNDPLMRFVDLSGTHLASAQRIVTPSWARILARTTAGDPLILAGETEGRRVAVVAFDLHRSDLPLQIAFPILIANLVEWLQPSQAVEAPPQLGAGDPISIRPFPEADEVRVTMPGDQGRYTSLQPTAQLSFGRTEALGVYTVQQMSKGAPLGEPESFAVNLFSREESDITPRPDLAFSGTEAAPNETSARRPLEIWPWVLLASLALLTFEWWLYNQPRLRATRSAKPNA